MPIPLVAEPEVLSRDALAGAAREAQAILSGAVKLARAPARSTATRAIAPPSSSRSPGSRRRRWRGSSRRRRSRRWYARVDFLVPEGGGAPRALELNATIPAMSGYADLAAHAWIRAAARGAREAAARGGARSSPRCGSHMERLREALVAYYRARGGTRERPSIALVARPGDAQIGELRRLAAHFRQMGHEAENLVPAECEPERWDVLYRHVWAHRVDPAAPVRARAPRARRGTSSRTR